MTKQSQSSKPSLIGSLARKPKATRDRAVRELGPAVAAALSRAWLAIARGEQLAPGTVDSCGILRSSSSRTDWTYWLYCAGRGTGKTRAGAEWTIDKARENSNSSIALVAPTADDARSVMLSSGRAHQSEASGILAVSSQDFYPRYEISNRRLVWPNGSVATTYSAEEPERLRGPQHHFAWVDEIAAWAKHGEAWDQLLFGLRLGAHPQACITTTPRSIPLLRRLLADRATVVTRGTTYDNRANLSPSWYASIITGFEGTRLGRQELMGEILSDVPGALWLLARIDELRREAPARLTRVVVAIDPAVSTGEDSDETGIVVAGVGPCRCLGGAEEPHGFVLADHSGKYTPLGWAREAIAPYRQRRADRIVAEVNNGGDLVEANLRAVDRGIPYKAVHASRGKVIRAEPIAALYEQGKVHHVGVLAKLEDQLTAWDPGASTKSPDRLDACVWALTELMGEGTMHQAKNIVLPDLSHENPWSI